MEIQPQPSPAPSREDQAHLATERLAVVRRDLKGLRRVLARDWEQLSPRERSAYSRKVKEAESQEMSLLEEIEMNGSV